MMATVTAAVDQTEVFSSEEFPSLCSPATVKLTLYKCSHRRGNDFWLGEQKLNDFSVGEAKIGEKQSRQSNSKYNFMQYVFFKNLYAVYNGVWGKTPEAREFSRIFVLN